MERTATKAGRGRPSHHYALTTRGRRKAGSNFGDLAVALWKEIVAIEDPSIRRALVQRVSRRLAEAYEVTIEGPSVRAADGAVGAGFSRPAGFLFGENRGRETAVDGVCLVLIRT